MTVFTEKVQENFKEEEGCLIDFMYVEGGEVHFYFTNFISVREDDGIEGLARMAQEAYFFLFVYKIGKTYIEKIEKEDILVIFNTGSPN